MPGIHAEDSSVSLLDRIVRSTTSHVATIATTLAHTTPTSTLPPPPSTTEEITTTTTIRSYFQAGLDAFNSGVNNIREAIVDTTQAATTTTTTTTSPPPIPEFQFEDDSAEQTITTTVRNVFENVISSLDDNLKSIADLRPDPTSNIPLDIDSIMPHAEAYSQLSTIAPFHKNATSCERVNIMGTIVQDSTPYLYPFIIEYSLIGAAVIYVMWKHIGRYPKFASDEDLEHRLEVMLSRRAVALAQVKSGRVDCVGASKGLFFGLLLLVGSLICFILFFVLVRHEQFQILAYYLADASHAGLMGFAILAILIGFCR
jgi:hypothetical protein